MKLKLVLALAVFCVAQPAAAQFNELVVFGDSTVDSGWWKGALQGQCGSAPIPCTTGNPNKDPRIANAIANGGTGAPVGVGLMNPEVLAGYYGLTVKPANQPGGTNYAISGAVTAASAANGNIGNLNTNTTLPSTVQQMANYLAGHGGAANSQALYLIGSGGNDITFATTPGNFPNFAARQAYLADQAATLANAILNLQVTGAQHILVHGLRGDGTLAQYFTQQLFTDLSALGVNFIGADVRSLVDAIELNPAAYGLTTTALGVPGTGTASACVWEGPPAAVGWGQFCGLTEPGNPNNRAYLRSPTAQQTSLYSDDQHFSAAGQAILAAYDYNLLNAAAVPGPMVGAGLPGLALGFGGLIVWARRRRKRALAA